MLGTKFAIAVEFLPINDEKNTNSNVPYQLPSKLYQQNIVKTTKSKGDKTLNFYSNDFIVFYY